MIQGLYRSPRTIIILVALTAAGLLAAIGPAALAATSRAQAETPRRDLYGQQHRRLSRSAAGTAQVHQPERVRPADQAANGILRGEGRACT